ncbi:MAG: structural cement protein Gp24 [Burkholderiaceae bacterium]
MQTAYTQYHGQAFAGLVADTGFTDKVSYTAEAAIGFGKPVMLGTDPARQVKPATAGATAFGFSLKEGAVEQPLAYGADAVESTYAAKTTVSVLRRGRVWVKTSDAVVAGAVARLTTADGTLTDAAAATGIEDFAGLSVRFVTGTAAAGLAIVEVNPK